MQIACCVLAFLTAVLNGFVSYLILSRAQLHVTANWFVLSLAVADLGFGLSFIPAAFLCNEDLVDCSNDSLLVYLICCFFLAASIANLCCVVADRLVYILRPLRYPLLVTKRRALIAMSFAWIIAFIFALSGGLAFLLPSSELDEVFVIAWIVTFLVLPSVFLVVSVACAIYVSRKLTVQTTVLRAQVCFNHPGEPSVGVVTVGNAAKIKSATMIMSSVACCFIACYSLDSYIYLCKVFHLPMLSSVKSVHVLLLVINSTFNPIAYSLFKKDIKAEVKRFFCSSEVLPSA